MARLPLSRGSYLRRSPHARLHPAEGDRPKIRCVGPVLFCKCALSLRRAFPYASPVDAVNATPRPALLACILRDRKASSGRIIGVAGPKLLPGSPHYYKQGRMLFHQQRLPSAFTTAPPGRRPGRASLRESHGWQAGRKPVAASGLPRRGFQAGNMRRSTPA